VLIPTLGFVAGLAVGALSFLGLERQGKRASRESSIGREFQRKDRAEDRRRDADAARQGLLSDLQMRMADFVTTLLLTPSTEPNGSLSEKERQKLGDPRNPETYFVNNQLQILILTARLNDPKLSNLTRGLLGLAGPNPPTTLPELQVTSSLVDRDALRADFKRLNKHIGDMINC